MSKDDNSKLTELNRRLSKTLDDERDAARKKRHEKGYRTATVSYTHLTLPTI